MDAADLRSRFPVLSRLAFLNAGTCGPVPAVAVEAARAELERQEREGRTHAHFEHGGELMGALRAAYAQALGCAPENVALTTSTSDGVATALTGLDLRPGDEIVTSDTEHPGLNGPLQAIRDVRGVSVRAVPLRDVADAVGPRTRVVACSHVSWLSGEVAPPALAEVDAVVLLDGAQGVGAVPVDLEALGCDLYAGSGQKWMCGPDGTGTLYVSPAMLDRLSPLRRWYLSFTDPAGGLDAELRPDCMRFDSPGLSTEAAAYALASARVLSEAGWPEVHARARDLAARLADALREAGLEVLDRARTTLVTWRSDDPEADVERAAAAGVVIRNFPGLPYVRASVGAWNDESDLERLLAAV
jgi:L-cysteine/cystine lyase